MAKVLVTGANGFVGGHLAAELASRGHRVAALVRRTSDLSALDGLAVEFRPGDVCDPASLRAAMEGIEVVFHVAGVTKARVPEDFVRVNRDGARNVARAAVEAGVRRLVHVSSIAAAGPSDANRPRTEAEPATPVSLYGLSKRAGEQEVEAVAAELDVVIVRPPIVYGPRDLDVLEVVRAAARGLVVQLGRAPKPYSVIHVRDLARGLILAAERGNPVGDGPPGTGIYFLTDGRRHTWAELGHAAARAVGRRARVIVLPLEVGWLAGVLSEWLGRLRNRAPILNRDKIREARQAGWWFSTERARAEIGYEPTMTLDAGMADAVAWARSAGKL